MRAFKFGINKDVIKKEFYYLKYGQNRTVILNWLLFEVEGTPLEVLDGEHKLNSEWHIFL